MCASKEILRSVDLGLNTVSHIRPKVRVFFSCLERGASASVFPDELDLLDLLGIYSLITR